MPAGGGSDPLTYSSPMENHMFQVTRNYWARENLGYYTQFALIDLLASGLLYVTGHWGAIDPIFLWISIALTILFLINYLFYRPKLTIRNGIIRMLQTKIPIAKIQDITLLADEYFITLKNRRNQKIPITGFSPEDREAIDRIFRQICWEQSAGMSKEETDKLSRDDTSDYEFAKRERWAGEFFGPLVIMTVTMGICGILTFLFWLYVGTEEMLKWIDPPYLWVLFAMWVTAVIVDRLIPRKTFIYSKGLFYIYSGHDLNYFFRPEELRQTGFDDFNKAIFFTLSDPTTKKRRKTKEFRIMLVGFRWKDKREIVSKVKSILQYPA